MKDGFIRVAAGVPKVSVADVNANTQNVKKLISLADKNQIKLLVLPELCITSSTCGDLFFNSLLISAAKQALYELAEFTKGKSPIVIVGLPLEDNGSLYNCAAVLKNGEILGIVKKTSLENSRISDESRYFSSLKTDNNYFKTDDFSFTVLIGDPCGNPINSNADIIVNLAAVRHTVGKGEKIKDTICNMGYACVFASSGLGESTTDNVFSGLTYISSGGKILAQGEPFCYENLIFSDVNIKNNYRADTICEQISKNTIEKNPFLPSFVDKGVYLEEILQIQSHALARRLEHTHAKKAVIGISGGLDSTLALLVCARAMKILNRPATDVLSITMPCFGTTSRTRSNSEILCAELGVDFKEINITSAVKQHFEDIGQSESVFDITYENSQARERTQVLMDIANKENGLVVGTGDLSELALGWATYNGDHMSMYGVNASVPKTLIRYIVEYEASNSCEELKNVLLDILATPVSPELLPANHKGEIAQKTEDLVGPYELHDFFIYRMLGLNENPKEIFNAAVSVFPEYSKETIKKWLTVFTRRFFTQQFKRSCLPDGPMVTEISLSPRGAFKMPTDASCNLWLSQIETL